MIDLNEFEGFAQGLFLPLKDNLPDLSHTEIGIRSR